MRLSLTLPLVLLLFSTGCPGEFTFDAPGDPVTDVSNQDAAAFFIANVEPMFEPNGCTGGAACHVGGGQQPNLDNTTSADLAAFPRRDQLVNRGPHQGNLFWDANEAQLVQQWLDML